MSLFAYLGKGSSVRYDGSIDGEFIFLTSQSNLRLTGYPLGPSSGCHPSLASARSDVRRIEVNKKTRVQSRREGRAWTCNISQGQQGYLHIGRFDMSPRLSGVSMPKPIETRDPCSTLFGGQGPLCRDEHGVDSRRCRYIPYTVYSPAMLTILSAAIRSSRRPRDSSQDRWVSASIFQISAAEKASEFPARGPWEQYCTCVYRRDGDRARDDGVLLLAPFSTLASCTTSAPSSPRYQRCSDSPRGWIAAG